MPRAPRRAILFVPSSRLQPAMAAAAPLPARAESWAACTVAPRRDWFFAHEDAAIVTPAARADADALQLSSVKKKRKMKMNKHKRRKRRKLNRFKKRFK